VFPTTTSVVWPTIITDKWPSEHGIYGTSFLHEKFNKNYVWITNTLNIKDERTLVNDRDMKLNLSGAETIFEKLKKQNIVSYYLGTHGQGVFNPFRSELTRGANHIEPGNIYPELKKDPQRLVDYFIDKDTELLKKEERCLIWNYIDFDDFIHEHGYEKLSEKINWDSIFEFWKVNKQDRLFIFISDHGQTIQKPGSSSILKTSTLNPDLAHNSAGAGRVLYFYPSQDKENDVYAWVKNIVGDEGVVMTKKDLINSGLINSNAAGINRIGSVIAIAKETGRSFPSTGYKYVAEHGALSSDEMYVPIIIQF
jgi:predicted AlkP superfamily pyrophosphatase or phosphodiesterase